jgi:hypothetical protein
MVTEHFCPDVAAAPLQYAMTSTHRSARNRTPRRLVRAATATATALLLGSVACTRSDDETFAKSKAPVVAADPVGVRPLCPEDGRWNQCVLLDRLVHAGLAPAADSTDTTHVAFLKPAGVHYRIGKSSQLIAFYFADSIAALNAWKPLDTLRLAPRTDSLSPWPMRPVPIRAANLVAVLLSENPAQIERVVAVFAAGLPAPRP